MKLRLPLVLLVLSACAARGPAVSPTRHPPDVVRLVFDWPADGEAYVEAHRTATDVSPRGRYVDEARITYRLKVMDEGDGVRLVWDHASVQSLPRRWIPRTVEMVAVELGQADFRVNSRGNFVELTEPLAAQARVASWATRTFAERSPSPAVHGRLADVLSEEAIARRMASFWGGLVGYWNGGSLELGRTYTAWDEIRVAGLGGIPVHMEVRATAQKWVPCGEDDPDQDCVELHLEARPAEDQIPLLQEFATAFFASDPARELRVEHDVVVITEPLGLRPRSMRQREVVEIPLAGGESILIADERILDFRWTTAEAREPRVD